MSTLDLLARSLAQIRRDYWDYVLGWHPDWEMPVEGTEEWERLVDTIRVAKRPKGDFEPYEVLRKDAARHAGGRCPICCDCWLTDKSAGGKGYTRRRNTYCPECGFHRKVTLPLDRSNVHSADQADRQFSKAGF